MSKQNQDNSCNKKSADDNVRCAAVFTVRKIVSNQ